MSITPPERNDLDTACRVAANMRDYDVRIGTHVTIRIDGKGRVVVTLKGPAVYDRRAWISACSGKSGRNTLVTDTSSNTLTFKPATPQRSHR
jgi:hypothetical protein